MLVKAIVTGYLQCECKFTQKFKSFKIMVLTVVSGKYGSFSVLFDDLDHELISKHNWFVTKGRNTFYVRTNSVHPVLGTRGFAMHQLISGFPKCTDHKNRCGWDNRRDNLRVSTVQENNRNATIQKNNTTGYRGVDYNKNHKAFRARVNINRKSVYCRYFKTAEEAALAYNKAAIKFFGDYANLNVINCA